MIGRFSIAASPKHKKRLTGDLGERAGKAIAKKIAL
jgi:hypothetical protein